jgi:Domain of unknown function (DUF4436)
MVEEAPLPTPHEPRWFLIGAVAVLIVAAIAIYFGLQNLNRSSPGTLVTSVEPPTKEDSVVSLGVTIEAINASSGFASLRLSARQGPAMPKEGVVIFSSLGDAPAIVVRPDQLVADTPAQVPFSSGSVADYPFEKYELTMAFVVFAGTETSLPNTEHATGLPFHLVGVDDAAGIDATASHKVEDQQVNFVMTLTRAASTTGWVLAMMAIYWLLALGALAVTLSIVAKLRPFETRQLAWLSALLFALVTFRTTAPGSPPIGTFFDFYAMFEGVAIVAAALLTLMVVYLVRSRGRLGL